MVGRFGKLMWRYMEDKRRAEREAEVSLLAPHKLQRHPIARAAVITGSHLYQLVMLQDAGEKIPNSC